jgi:hypothetical protein
LISICYSDVVVSHTDIKLCEQRFSVQLFNQVRDERERVFVGYRMFVQNFVVLNYTIVAILFLDEKGWARVWGF